jgi:NAD(P)H-hydrate epimerase
LVNTLPALRIAIDVPSGLDAATGDAHENCFVADHTITMAAVKSGLFLKGAKDVCGNVRVAPIGLSDAIVQSRAFAHIVEHHDVMAMYSPRKSDTSKFDYGRVCVIAGSRDMPGAAALCANAAILCGAGMVELCSTAFHPHLLPEVLRMACSKADCIVIGPGIGNHEQTLSVIAALIAEFGNHKPVIVDADGLRTVPCSGPVGVNVVLTPHQGELARLFQRCEAAGASVKSASVKSVSELASYLGCIVVAKGVPVRISNGSHELWNVNGNAGMATAGSGDVAAGVIAAMVCRLRRNGLTYR